MSEMIAEFTPAPPSGGRTPGLIRPAHTSDAGRDLACRLYSAETGVLIANTEAGQLPRGDDVANAAFIRLAWNSHDALVQALTNARVVLGEARETFMVLDGGDESAELVAAIKQRTGEIDAILAGIEGAAS